MVLADDSCAEMKGFFTPLAAAVILAGAFQVLANDPPPGGFPVDDNGTILTPYLVTCSQSAAVTGYYNPLGDPVNADGSPRANPGLNPGQLNNIGKAIRNVEGPPYELDFCPNGTLP